MTNANDANAMTDGRTGSGAALDALVAQKVMGWTLGDGPWSARDGRTYYDGFFRSSWEDDVGLTRTVWQPSTDIVAAWQVAERLRISVVFSEDGFYAIKAEDVEHGYVRGTNYPRMSLVGREGEEWEPAPTAPLAICRAALAAVEVQR